MTMKRYIWVESLAVPDVMALLVETALFGGEVRYDENKASFAATRSVAFLKGLGLCRNFHEAGLALNRKDRRGYAINYWMEKDHDSCLTAFCDRYCKDEPARFQKAVRLYIASYLTYRVKFITMVEHTVEFRDRNAMNVIVLKRHPVNSAILSYYRKKGLKIRESFGIAECLTQYLKPAMRIWRICAARISIKEARAHIDPSRPAVWVEHVRGCIPDYIFWKEGIDRTGFDIVCYFDRSDNVDFGEEAARIEKEGLRWIDLHFGPLARYARIGPAQILAMAGAFFSLPVRVPLWFRVFKFEFTMWRLLYEPVFRAYKVKVLIQHQAALWTQVPQLEALEAAGGIALGFNRHNYITYKEAIVSNFQHIYFVWGNVIRERQERAGSMCRYFLPSGLCVVPQKESRVPCDLKEGLDFVIAILDSSAAYFCHQGEDTLAEFYIRVLRLIEDNGGWGGIVKSKHRTLADIGRLPRGEEIAVKIERLIGQKRLVYMDASNSPLTASLMADLSVCYSINSAGIIAGAHGLRAVHWDCTGLLHHPFYKDAGQKFVYGTMDELEQAIIKASRGDATIGDFSAWRRQFNHFDDDKAPARIGRFIQDYMREESLRSDPSFSLRRAVEKYRADNEVDEDFYRDQGMWETEDMGAVEFCAR